MRLTVFGPAHPFRGGIAVTMTSLVRTLVGRGHDVVFLTPRRQYPSWLYPGPSDRDPAACERLEQSRAILDPMNPFSWARARRAALEGGAEAWVFPYWTWAWAGLWSRLLATTGRPPVVAIVHNPSDHDGSLLQRVAARRVLTRCDALFTHAERLAEHLASSYPRLPNSWHPLAVDSCFELPRKESARYELGLAPDDPVALFLGFVRPYKGVDLLVEAFAEMGDTTPFKLVVAGEPWGDLARELQAKVAGLGLGERVHLHLRWVPEGEMSRYLAAADVVVLPYRSGSQSAVAPLALAHGIPVIATDVGGLSEIVRDGVNGLIVPPDSREALVRAFGSLDRDRLGKLRKGAEEGVGKLSWDDYAARLEELAAKVVRAPSPLHQ